MKKNDERNIDPIREILEIIKKNSLLTSLGFRESFRTAIGIDKLLIFDSEYCRMKFVWGGWDVLTGNTISIYYGRLHAPNESITMYWENDKCYAWHRFEHTLHFLDKRSPDDAATMNYLTPLTSKYFEKAFRRSYHRRQPEWLMMMHMEVWEHYGKRFFELFDLGRPDLWEQYRKFLKEFYDIKGRSSFIDPPMDSIC